MKKKKMKKLIHIAAVAAFFVKETLEWVLASAIHMAFWVLMSVMALGIGMGAALFIYGGFNAYMQYGEMVFTMVLHFGCLFGIMFAVAQRCANYLSRLDIERQREEERKAKEVEA